MVELTTPVREAFELRVVVWDAKDVVPTDTLTGTADVRISLQPRGSSGDYEKQSTDVHMFSSGDAQFNWRMVWPVFLPEKTPRLFVQARLGVRPFVRADYLGEYLGDFVSMCARSGRLCVLTAR